jgi:2-polyprenyl-6-methoxyphenol hydroxylase-like FAD-dependent oxidoreductase
MTGVEREGRHQQRGSTVGRGTVLISGAGVAGPTLAYWLHRHGFRTTVVERTPALRRGWGGHAVDLFGPAVDVAERMGILEQVLEARTRTELIRFLRPGKSPVEVDFTRLVAGIADRHVEIMRGELAAILHHATRDDVEYVFGDSVRSLAPDDAGVDVTFEHGAPRRFNLVVGADGLHSTVRRLTFGDESRFRRYLGGYLAVYTVPNHLHLQGQMLTQLTPGKLAATYPVRQTGQARAAFLFRRQRQFDYDHRDLDRQKQLLREVYADEDWEIPRLLAGLGHADDFYFDSISQIVMDRWSAGRVTLVGDAGYSPGAAVGGGTSVAVIGAYLLAAALRDASGDHSWAFDRYEHAMRELVTRSRRIGPATMTTLVPATRRQVWLTIQAMRLVPRLPPAVQRRLFAFQSGPATALESVTLPNSRDPNTLAGD